MTRRIFTKAYKRRAVRRVEGGQSIMAVAKKLDVVDSVLRRWVKNTKELGHVSKERGSYKKKTPKSKRMNGSKNGPKMPSIMAIAYLRHARDAMVIQITQDPQRFDDPVYRLTISALEALEGRQA